MGKKSRLKNLGLDLKARVAIAGTVVKTGFQQGQATGQALKLYMKLKPMEKHLDSGKCPYCGPLFREMKNCPEILDLPEGSDAQATEHILKHEYCRERLKKILDCPVYRYGEDKVSS